MNTVYKAQVVATFHNGQVPFWTYVSASSKEEAKTKLERSGYDVVSIQDQQTPQAGEGSQQ